MMTREKVKVRVGHFLLRPTVCCIVNGGIIQSRLSQFCSRSHLRGGKFIVPRRMRQWALYESPLASKCLSFMARRVSALAFLVVWCCLERSATRSRSLRAKVEGSGVKMSVCIDTTGEDEIVRSKLGERSSVCWSRR